MFKLILILLALTNAGNRIAAFHLLSQPTESTHSERGASGARKAFKLFVARGGGQRIEMSIDLLGAA